MKPPSPHKFLWWRVRPITARRLANFRAHRRGYWSMWIFAALFVFTLFAEFIANDRPLLVWYDGGLYTPVLKDYPERTFGGDLPGNTDFSDTFIREEIAKKGWMLWPLVPYSHKTSVKNLTRPAPTPPSWQNWLGTDNQARDVLARVIYGFRVSVLFGLVLTIASSIVGVIAGAVQGYFGGWVDLSFQRFIEIWTSIPTLYVLLIVAAVLPQGFFVLLGILLLFSWTSLVGVVRAEFLRTRNFEYVQAARALGVSNSVLMYRHILPNAMVATLTFMPFILSGSVMTLTALDYLGYGLPPGSPSLGELLNQGRNNLQAPWLGITGFFTVAILLTLLIFIGEAIRDAFDPRKTFT